MKIVLSEHPLARALWNLRWLGLFAVGPTAGIVLVNFVFGLPALLIPLAGGMLLLMLSLYATLLGSEYRRIRETSRPPR